MLYRRSTIPLVSRHGDSYGRGKHRDCHLRRRRQFQARDSGRPDGKVWVTSVVGNSVGVIDPTNSNAVTAITDPSIIDPWGIAIAPDGKVYIANSANDSVAIIDPANGNVPLADISAWLGHASSAFTLSVYVHSQANALQAAAASFDRVVTTRDTETGSGG